jgi:hypothetical protein
LTQIVRRATEPHPVEGGVIVRPLP